MRWKQNSILFAMLVIGFACGALLLTFAMTGTRPSPGPLAQHLVLEDEYGRPFTQTTIRAHPTVLFLGYTTCPDICPTTLVRMRRWADMLTPHQAHALTFGFLSIDPERDTVAVRRVYVQAFDKRIKGLSGSQDEVRRLSMLVDAPYRVELDPAGGYSFSHSSDVIVLGTDGRVAKRITPTMDDNEAAASLRRVLAKPANR